MGATTGAHAQVSDGVVKIGVLNDQSSLYADVGGPGSVVAARMAVAGDMVADIDEMQDSLVLQLLLLNGLCATAHDAALYNSPIRAAR